MEARVVWKEKMLFTGESGLHQLSLDAKAPIGKDQGFSPKELVAIGIAGCTAMDVASLFRKYKQEVTALEILASVTHTEGYPVRFKSVELTFKAEGHIDPEKFKEAVHLSQSKYCGVSAMIAATAPINYHLVLNGEKIHSGAAEFKV